MARNSLWKCDGAFLLLLVFTATLGVLLRQGLTITVKDNSSLDLLVLHLFPELLANILGAFFLPLCSALEKTLPDSQTATRISLALSIGFCGSLTTFSSWINRMVEFTINYRAARTSLPSTLETLSSAGVVIWVLVLGMSLPMAAMEVGSHAASGIVLLSVQTCKRKPPQVTPPSPPILNEADLNACGRSDSAEGSSHLEPWSRNTPEHANELACMEKHASASVMACNQFKQEGACDFELAPEEGSSKRVLLSMDGACFLSGFLGLSSLAATGLLAIFDDSKNRGLLWLPSVCGFAGCWIRFFLSRLNRRTISNYRRGCQVFAQRLPLGTLICNVSATALSALATGILTLEGDIPPLGRDALQAVAFGVAGSLSTMSTFCNELRSVLTIRCAYLYGAASISSAFFVGLAVRAAF